MVVISALGRGTAAAAHAGLVTASLKMDDLIASSRVQYRAVINPSFMDNLLRQAEEMSPVCRSPTCDRVDRDRLARAE